MDRTVRALTDLSAVDDQLSDRESLIDGLVPALEQRRAALREAIPGIFLATYDALGRAGRRPVVVQMRGSHCGGCYLRLPPQLDSSIRLRQSLRPCPHCRRLLYSFPPQGDTENTNASKHEIGHRPTTGKASKQVRYRPKTGKASKQVRRIPRRRSGRRVLPSEARPVGRQIQSS